MISLSKKDLVTWNFLIIPGIYEVHIIHVTCQFLYTVDSVKELVETIKSHKCGERK